MMTCTTDKVTLSLSLFIIQQCRKFGLISNESATILSHGDELQVMQYCLACHNKENGGQLEADPDDVVMLVDKVKKSAMQDIEHTLQAVLSSESIVATEKADESHVAVSAHDDGVMVPTKSDGHSVAYGVNDCHERSANVVEDVQKDAQNISITLMEGQTSNPSSSVEAAVLELFQDYKVTNNHWSLMDVYFVFMKTVLDQQSSLYQSLITSKDIHKLEIDTDSCDSIQAKILRFLQKFCNIISESRKSSDMEVTVDLSETPSEVIQSSSQPQPQLLLMSPKTPVCNRKAVAANSAGKTPISSHVAMATPRTPVSPSSGRGLKEIFVEDLFRSYMHLLVNSRSQLALARVFNIPERGLDHKAFTYLKHEASVCGLSMFQMLSSFMLRIQLGGQGYAPTKDNPLMTYIKGLDSLLHMIQKLQMVIEEVPDTRAACSRFVNIIKHNLIQCKSGKFPCSLVGPVSENIRNILSTIIQETESKNDHSPDKALSNGGSMTGRQCLRIIRQFLDRKALAVSQLDLFLMNDIRFSSKSPKRFPCLLTQFRSPSIMEVEDKDGHNHNKIIDSPRCRPRRSNNHFQVSAALYVDSKQSSDLLLTQTAMSSIEVLPSITVVHPRAAVKGHSSRETISTSSGTCALSETSKITSHKCKGGKRFAASSLDKENLIASPVSHPAPNLTVKSLDPNAAGSISRMSKRASIQEDISNKPKKSVKSCRRRLLPQVKGQAKITGFFRM